MAPSAAVNEVLERLHSGDVGGYLAYSIAGIAAFAVGFYLL